MAQIRNESHAILRLLPMESAIRMKAEQQKRGALRSTCEQLPPLTSREDMLYFRFDEAGAATARPTSNLRCRSPHLNSPLSLTMRGGSVGATPLSGTITDRTPRQPQPPMDGSLLLSTQRTSPPASMEKLQRLLTTSVPTDEDALDPDKVIHDVEWLSPTPRQGALGFPAKHHARTGAPQLPPPLQQALEATSYRMLLSAASPRRPAPASPRLPRPPVCDKTAKKQHEHRWFHHIPERAPTPSYHLSPVPQPLGGGRTPSSQTAAFDQLLLQTLRGAEKAGLVRLS